MVKIFYKIHQSIKQRECPLVKDFLTLYIESSLTLKNVSQATIKTYRTAWAHIFKRLRKQNKDLSKQPFGFGTFGSNQSTCFFTSDAWPKARDFVLNADKSLLGTEMSYNSFYCKRITGHWLVYVRRTTTLLWHVVFDPFDTKHTNVLSVQSRSAASSVSMCFDGKSKPNERANERNFRYRIDVCGCLFGPHHQGGCSRLVCLFVGIWLFKCLWQTLERATSRRTAKEKKNVIPLNFFRKWTSGNTEKSKHKTLQSRQGIHIKRQKNDQLPIPCCIGFFFILATTLRSAQIDEWKWSTSTENDWIIYFYRHFINPISLETSSATRKLNFPYLKFHPTLIRLV